MHSLLPDIYAGVNIMSTGFLLGNISDISAFATGFLLPVDGAVYANIFGADSSPARNLINGRPDATVIGSPVVNDRSVTLTSMESYIDTGVKQTGEMTIITLGQPAGTTSNFIHWSNYGSPVTNGGSGLTSNDFAQQSNATGNPTLSLGYTLDNFATRLPLSYGITAGADTVKRRAIASVFSQSAMTTRLRDLVNKKSQQNAIPANGVLLQAGNILLGSHYTAATASKGDLYFAAIYPRALTDAEIDAVYVPIKAFFGLQ